MTEAVLTDLQRGIPFCVAFFQKVLQRVLAHEVSFRLVHLPERGIHVDIAEVITKEKCEKAVHSGDLRIVKERLLPLQMRVARVLFNSLCDGGADPLPHLCRRGFGKGDDQKPVDIKGRIPLADHTDDPLDKNGRLAAAGRRGNQYIVISCLQDSCLLACKCNCHICNCLYRCTSQMKQV